MHLPVYWAQFFCLSVHLSVFLTCFQQQCRGKPQEKVAPTLSQILIIEEGRRGENGSCNIHMSYWLDCQPLAHAPSTYEVSQMTEDPMLRPPTASSYISLPPVHSNLLSICHLLSFFTPFPLSHFFFCPPLLPPATSFHPLLICCHLSEEYGIPMGQIQL